MLHHAATNTAGIVVSTVLPGLVVLPVLGLVRLPLEIALALLIIVATRGRLSYERYRRETAADGPGPRRESTLVPGAAPRTISSAR
jgi:hypothetical protein